MPKARLRRVAPTSVNRTVPRRPKNKDLPTREHLTEKEVERLIKAVGDNRYGHRDGTMVLIAFRTACVCQNCATYAGIRLISLKRTSCACPR